MKDLHDRGVKLLADIHDVDSLLCDHRELELVEAFAHEIRNETLEDVAKFIERHRTEEMRIVGGIIRAFKTRA